MPKYWYMSYKYCKAHDEILRSLMAIHPLIYCDEYVSYLGNIEIWTTNFPYAVGIRDLHQISRPSRRTIYELGKIIKSKETYFEKKKEYQKYIQNSF